MALIRILGVRWHVVALLALLTPSELQAAILSSKRGFADVGANYTNLQATGAGWYYTWGTGAGSPGNFDAKHYPMIWGGTPSQATLNNIKNANPEYVLGFNEPERPDQANMTVAQAIASWTTISNGLAGSGIKLVSPAVADTGGADGGQAWLASFMTQANAAGLQVDAVAFHWYGVSNPNNPAGAASSFLSRVDSYFNSYGKPVFITEFAIHDWGGAYTDEEITEANRQFLDIVIPGLESRNHVAGYAWYHWFSDARLYSGTPATPTPMSHAYIGALRTGESENVAGRDLGEHAAYLAGGTLQQNGATAGTVRYVSALAGKSTLAGTVDWSMTTGNWVRIQPGAVLRKSSANTLNLLGAAVANNGVLEVAQGRLTLGSSMTGSGSVVVSGGTLAVTGRGNLSTARAVEVRSGALLDVSALSGFTAGNGQLLMIESGANVLGSVFAGAGSTVSAAGTIGGNLTALANSRVQVGGAPTTVVYSDAFNGSATLLNGTVEAARGGTWTANAPFRANGQIDGTVEGSALLPFTPSLNSVYELTLDVFNTTDRWLALGFARDPIVAPGVDSLTDRFANETEGIAWMLYRNQTSNPAQSIELFGGLRTANSIADTNAAINFNRSNTLKIVIDTTGTGANFTADFQLDQGAGFVSLSNGPKTVNVSVNDVNFVGMSFDDATTASITIDNFQLVKKAPSGGHATTVQGDVTLNPGSILEFDLFGPTSVDRLTVAGNLAAGGMLSVALAAGAPAPQLGDSYQLFDFATADGSFDSFMLPSLAAGLAWNVSDLTATGELSVVANVDLDGNGVVDGGDYLLLQRDNPALLSQWAAQYGQQLIVPAVAVAASVPEPASVALSVAAASLAAVARRRFRRR
ncbi:MAG: hypothetical protein KF688_07465 [Pirellulales bacterium]|nr:hypothetical protein [Pirellulales bacterium]